MNCEKCGKELKVVGEWNGFDRYCKACDIVYTTLNDMWMHGSSFRRMYRREQQLKSIYKLIGPRV